MEILLSWVTYFYEITLFHNDINISFDLIYKSKRWNMIESSMF